MTLQYSLIIIFIHACLQEGMILGKLRWLMDEYIPYEWIRKPLYDCVVCMSGTYTVALWFIKDHRPLSWDLLWTICIVGGINVVLSPIVDAMIFEFHRRRTSDGEETE